MHLRTTKVHLAGGVLAVLVCLGLVPGPALAVTPTSVRVEDGMAISPTWTTCQPQTFELETAAPDDALPVPAIGEVVDDSGGIVVTGFRREGSTAIWDLAPLPEICAAFGDQLSESLSDATLRLRWTDRRLVVRAGERSGIRSFAGFRVNDWHAPPTIRAAFRAFGRPSAIKHVGREGCSVTWNRIGLRVVFVTFSGESGCRHGYFQAAWINDPSQWAVVVGSRPGIVETSQPGYLAARGRADDGDNGWPLAEVYIPWGEPGYYPSIGAHGPEDGPIESYDLWVGAGGD